MFTHFIVAQSSGTFIAYRSNDNSGDYIFSLYKSAQGLVALEEVLRVQTIAISCAAPRNLFTVTRSCIEHRLHPDSPRNKSQS